MKTVIIGAGVAGLASAIRMAVKGHTVEVYESNAYPGGKLSEINLGNYRFDFGPSVFTMPEYFEELFNMAGKSFKDYCPYKELEIVTKYFYNDGTIVNAYADKEKFTAEMQSKLGVETDKVYHQLENSAAIYNSTKDIFLSKSLHTFKQHSTLELIKGASKIPQLNLFSTMSSINKRNLNNEKAEQFFNRFATYNGSNPYEAPGTLNVIAHLEHNIGCFFPKGGMYSLTKSLHQLGQELGVKYHFNTTVEAINVKDKKAVGIVVNNENINADKVISAIDIMPTYRKLMPNEKAPEKILKQDKSSSAIVFYWGIKKKFEELILHNILFAKDYKAEFESIFKKKLPYSDPTVYINITSKHNTNDAIENGENWFVMINVPNNDGQDWDTLVAEARKNIIKKINDTLNTDIEKYIEEETTLDPRTIQSKTGSHLGALYGNASNNKFAAFLRHANFSNKIDNLYFCGGSVHPGGGIPLCMLSAKIVDELMQH